MEGPPDCDDNQSSSSAVGVKLPYFHRTQSQQDKDLIGDITPKVINIHSDPSSGSKSILSSASWNTADTWEERDCSERSSDNMKNIFSSDFEISCDGYCIKLGTFGKINFNAGHLLCFLIFQLHYSSMLDGHVDRNLTMNFKLCLSFSTFLQFFLKCFFVCRAAACIPEKLKGSSQVTHVRGKARFFYDYSFELSFKISNSSAQSFTGMMQLLFDKFCFAIVVEGAGTLNIHHLLFHICYFGTLDQHTTGI
jgi:hypothetical protein